jgi:hypothetical protein
MMLVRAASMCMAAAWVISKLHHFQLHWHAHSNTWASARLLLDSEVCTRANLRMELREFDNCEKAEAFIRISPFNRAVYSLAEEMHVCGNDRCAILYMDITDRLPYIFGLLAVLLILVMYKLARDYKYGLLVAQCDTLRLPHHKEQ